MALTPPDLERCQAEYRSFMTLGPGMHRCDKKPTFIAVEKEVGKDGERGSMSVCDEHKSVLEKQMPNCTDFVPVELWSKKSLIEVAKKRFKSENFDSFVHELKAQEAADINNDGVDSQLEYMIEKGGTDWVREILGTEKK